MKSFSNIKVGGVKVFHLDSDFFNLIFYATQCGIATTYICNDFDEVLCIQGVTKLKHRVEKGLEEAINSCDTVEGITLETQEKAREFVTEFYEKIKDDEEFWKRF